MIVRSSKAAYSSMGQQYASMAQTALKGTYNNVSVVIANSIEELSEAINTQPDLVFLGVKQLPASALSNLGAEMIWVSDYLDAQGVTHTGSASGAISLDYNKSAAKRVVIASGVCTAASFMALPEEYLSEVALPLALPVFVKPPSGGGGHGIGPDSVARTYAQYANAVTTVHRTYGTPALIESYLTGREFSVGVIVDCSTATLQALPMEIVALPNARGDRVLGREVKAADNEQVLAVPAGPMRAAVEALAVAAFVALGARDYGRIDIRCDENGQPHFLEANLIPGLHSRTSYFTKAYIANTGRSYEDMIVHVTELGLYRAQILQTDTEEFVGDVMSESSWQTLPA